MAGFVELWDALQTVHFTNSPDELTREWAANGL